jgi:DNA polymerase III epsilon subunit family exonuclease
MERHPSSVPLVFFDLESTGGNPHNSEVIEIAAVKEVDGVEVGRFQTLVNPRRNIPRIVRSITGIDNDTVRNAPTIEKVVDDFLDFIGDGILVSHGAINDYAFVAEYSKRYRGKKFENYYVCTHLLVSNFLPNIPNKKLAGLAEYFGVKGGQAHRALADAEMTRDVFWKLLAVLEKNGFHSVEDLLKLQADNATLNRLGSGLLARDFERAPGTPGIVYLFNASRELSYVSATSNVKRTLSGVTELSDEREFNRLLVDLTDYRFERMPHFLGALLREKRELKKLHLPIDPRKYEARANGYVQLLLPGDLVEHMRHVTLRARDTGADAGFVRVPVMAGAEFDWAEEAHNRKGVAYFPSMDSRNDHGFVPIRKVDAVTGLSYSDERNYAYQNWVPKETEELVVPVRKARRIGSALRTQKYQFSRLPDTNDVVRVGHLQEGLGWFFGPFEAPKVVKHSFDDLVTLFPFHDDTLSMEERVENLEIILRFLFGQLAPEVARLEAERRAPRNLLKPLYRKQLAHRLERLALLDAFPFKIKKAELPRTGLALISNNDTKEMDVMVVVGGRVRREARLPQEQTDKLKSARYFTRLFNAWHEDLHEPWHPVQFTEDVCTDIELFNFWLLRRRGEGEWVEFADLEPLYDTNILT